MSGEGGGTERKGRKRRGGGGRDGRVGGRADVRQERPEPWAREEPSVPPPHRRAPPPPRPLTDTFALFSPPTATVTDVSRGRAQPARWPRAASTSRGLAALPVRIGRLASIRRALACLQPRAGGRARQREGPRGVSPARPGARRLRPVAMTSEGFLDFSVVTPLERRVLTAVREHLVDSNADPPRAGSRSAGGRWARRGERTREAGRADGRTAPRGGAEEKGGDGGGRGDVL